MSVVSRQRLGWVNIGMFGLQFSTLTCTLLLLPQLESLILKGLLLFVFCMVMQGTFSLIHECIHDVGYPTSKTANYWLGVATGIIFGTSYTLYRINHDGHHVRNRSEPELSEFILPNDRPWLKIFTYYFAICGGIWLGSLVASIVIPLIPRKFVFFVQKHWRNGYTLSFNQFRQADWRNMRREAWIGAVFWLIYSQLLGVSLTTLAVAYSCFAFSYSSLQWVYHVHTPLHPVEGAYDLRLPRWIQFLFMNFNYNLSHHRHPKLPWTEIAAKVNLQETQPLWYRYLLVFRCPRRMPDDMTRLEKVYF